MRRLAWEIFIGMMGLFALEIAYFLPTAAAEPFAPPTEIAVHMFELEYPSGAATTRSCYFGNERYGCTAVPDNWDYAYPYGSEWATVSIERDYLLDVVPQEMGTYYHATAIMAQAIAARSYACWYIDHGYAINNSASYQVFLPWKFESLTSPLTKTTHPEDPCASANLNFSQQVVCQAVTPRHYIAYGADERPARTEFTADVYGQTLTHPNQGTLYPYLLGVPNPISTACDANNDGINLAGLSQEGASRWARGHQCSYAGTLPGNRWAVAWSDARLILTHYYTGVHVRDANNGNALLTPPRRFAVLSVNGGPASNPVCAIETVYLTVRLHNTGVETWQPWAVGVGFCWGQQCQRSQFVSQAVEPGAAWPPTGEAAVSIPPGRGELTLDMFYQPCENCDPEWFSASQTAPWPRQSLRRVVSDCRQRLPFINQPWPIQ